MIFSTSKIIPLEKGGYIIRGQKPAQPVPKRDEDALMRTPQDNQFREQFQALFDAAVGGDLKTCRSLVEKGFSDFNAAIVKPNVGKVNLIEAAQSHADVAAYFRELKMTGSTSTIEGSHSSPRA